MANNGFVKFITSAKAIITIILAIIALVVWFLSVEGACKTNVKSIQTNGKHIDAIKKEMKEDNVKEQKIVVNQAVIQKDVETIKADVGELRTEQRSMRKDVDRKLDRIYDKVK